MKRPIPVLRCPYCGAPDVQEMEPEGHKPAIAFRPNDLTKPVSFYLPVRLFRCGRCGLFLMFQE